MYSHILIATDGSELATRGLEHGLDLAKATGAAVTIVTVTEIWSALAMAGEAQRGVPDPVAAYELGATAAAHERLEAGVRLAEAHGVAAEPLHIADSAPAQAIVRAAADKGCDLIVMASHGRRGLRRMMLGSQALEVLTYSKVPVLIVR